MAAGILVGDFLFVSKLNKHKQERDGWEVSCEG